MIPFPYKQKLTTCLATTVSCECKYLSLQNTNKKNMKTSLKAGFAQIFSCCPKNLSCPKFGGGCSPPRPPRPVRLWTLVHSRAVLNIEKISSSS